MRARIAWIQFDAAAKLALGGDPVLLEMRMDDAERGMRGGDGIIDLQRLDRGVARTRHHFSGRSEAPYQPDRPGYGH